VRVTGFYAGTQNRKKISYTKNIKTMKKLNIFAVLILASASVNVMAQNEVNMNDFAYQMAKLQRSHYTDHVVYTVGDDPHEYTAGAMAKDGAYMGITIGGQHFDGHTTPFAGGVLGWEGGPRTPIKFEYNGTVTVGHYTKEADRDDKYAEFDSRLIGALCPYISKGKTFRWWLGGYFSYKLSFDYHKNESTYTTVRETEDEVITTTDKVGNDYEFKASSVGAGGYTEISFQPYMSRVSYRFYVGGGLQQRFYSDGNRFHPEFFGGVRICYNFSASKLWDQSFLQKTGLTKKQAKKLSKKSATVKNY
jgi:hypothetical protein